MKAKLFFDRHGRPANEDDALDERGILRDGYALRHSLMMKDGASNQQQIDHALAETKRVMQTERGVRDGVMLDLVNDDAKKQAYADKSAADCNAWRQDRLTPAAHPVPARDATMLSLSDGNATKEAAYAEASKQAQNAWRRP